ncbi:hypothetical protein CDIK_1130 [Cucumispora dikerogammari]|nr:hypothetical protein CDIK_1130 [Cucumispora dikerogammari]
MLAFLNNLPLINCPIKDKKLSGSKKLYKGEIEIKEEDTLISEKTNLSDVKALYKLHYVQKEGMSEIVLFLLVAPLDEIPFFQKPSVELFRYTKTGGRKKKWKEAEPIVITRHIIIEKKDDKIDLILKGGKKIYYPPRIYIVFEEKAEEKVNEKAEENVNEEKVNEEKVNEEKVNEEKAEEKEKTQEKEKEEKEKEEKRKGRKRKIGKEVERIQEEEEGMKGKQKRKMGGEEKIEEVEKCEKDHERKKGNTSISVIKNLLRKTLNITGNEINKSRFKLKIVFSGTTSTGSKIEITIRTDFFFFIQKQSFKLKSEEGKAKEVEKWFQNDLVVPDDNVVSQP